MVKQELVKRSPLRILEKSIRGGVGHGNIAVIAARKGTGKTACLVHIATDQLLQGKHVIHASFAERTDHIISWYEDIFAEIAERRSLDDTMGVHDEIVKHRVIMNFVQSRIGVDQFLKSLESMIGDGQFAADTIIVDGYDFEHGEPATFMTIREFAMEKGLELWFSASIHRDDPRVDANGIPMLLSPFLESISVLITLQAESPSVKLSLLKDHDRYVTEDLHLMLDPRSLLIAEER
jgi:hypothetical protein